MISGPALKHIDSHSSIHEAAVGEAEQLTQLLEACMEAGEHEKAYEIACVVLEHWETRILAHAEVEEEGLYKEIVAAKPEWRDKTISLSRDHTLMRQLAADIRQLLANQKITMDIVKRFQAMLLIDFIHNSEEESMVASIGDSQ